jgi:hypothetical protein
MCNLSAEWGVLAEEYVPVTLKSRKCPKLVRSLVGATWLVLI